MAQLKAIFDLHADLLSYLASSETASPYDPNPHCSLDQLKLGKVQLQVLPVFTKTEEGSVRDGERQRQWYLKLIAGGYPVSDWRQAGQIQASDNLFVLPAIENCSGFFTETEPFEVGLARLENFTATAGEPVYVGLTWFGDNRFGGGNDSDLGLTKDGARLLEFFVQQKIKVDLSHASDPLVRDLLAFDNLKVISSHSNARAIKPIQRCLEDHVIQEVVKRGGLLGVNGCIKQHSGNKIQNWVDNFKHFLSLGAENSLCFGIDFYDDSKILSDGQSAFFADCQDASKMQVMVEALAREGYSDTQLEKWCSGNVNRWLSSQLT